MTQIIVILNAVKDRNQRIFLGVAFAVVAALGGCHRGAGSGVPDPSEVLAGFQQERPKDQIATIQQSPASPERKAQLIHDIEIKYGVTADAAPVGGRAPMLSAHLTPSNPNNSSDRRADSKWRSPSKVANRHE